MDYFSESRLKTPVAARGILLFSVTVITIWFVLQGYSSQVSFAYKQYFQDDPSFLRQAVLKVDDYIRLARINISDIERLKNSLKEYGKLIPAKTYYKISLTEKEQRIFNSSPTETSTRTGAQNVKWASFADLNLMKKGPFPLLPDFKTPCWFTSHHELRCLPFFYLIGCPKCGTTDLFRMMKAHPDFRAFMKEPHWLTRRRFNTIVPYGFDKYTENMARPLSDVLKHVSKTAEQKSSDDILRHRDADMKAVAQNVVLGDCSASTIWDNLHWKYLEGNSLPLEPTLTNADYIYHLNNKTKIVAILRNPITRRSGTPPYCPSFKMGNFLCLPVAAVDEEALLGWDLPTKGAKESPKEQNPSSVQELIPVKREANEIIELLFLELYAFSRLYSDYSYFHRGEERSTVDFHHDVISSVREISKCFEKFSIRSCVNSKETVLNMRVRLWIGIYFIHLQEWFKVFPREQIFIIRLEDYTEHKAETVRKLYHFLTLKNATKGSFERRSQSSVAANSNKHLAYQNSSMLEETRYILYTFYKPFNQELARLLNDTPCNSMLAPLFGLMSSQSGQKKTTKLKQMLNSPDLEFIMEAHNGICARIVQEAGFKGIWGSGLSVSAQLGVRDSNEASWTQVLEVLEFMSDASDIPILLDADTGYGNFNNARRLVKKLEDRGIAGACIEDKVFPKTNSLHEGRAQPLADIDEFALKIKACKDSQRDPDFCIVARVEAFIAGWDLDEALRRAEAYRNAGADAILMHSKRSDPKDVEAFMKVWNNQKILLANIVDPDQTPDYVASDLGLHYLPFTGFKGPVIIVPTKYYKTPTQVFRDLGISMVIWANHNMRASVKAIQETSAQIYKDQSLINVEPKIVSVKEVFRLTNDDELVEAEEKYLPKK